jgi:queuine/archaeosine tRNA-ribosyltransferase
MKFLKENSRSRKLYFPVRGKALRLPIYFPSISSVKTGLSPFDYFNVLEALQQTHFLVSAFDIDKSFQREEFIKALETTRNKNGAIILMDSGNYESYWIRDKSWTIEGFNEILKHDVSDLAFCYDNQFPPDDSKENATGVAMSTKKSQEVATATSIIPIIHCTKEKLNDAVLELCNQTNSPMISIPERILGDGLLERVKTITNLRKELNKLDNYTFIHLLGTGNPFSLLLFSLAGADSFDGLEWCQTTVNSETALLYHFQQRELINDNCTFCKSGEFDYNLTTLGHNLIFYNDWMKKIQDTIETNSEEDLLHKYFDAKFVNYLTKLWS